MATKQSKTNSNGNKAEVAKLLKALAAAPKGSSEKRHIRAELRKLGHHGGLGKRAKAVGATKAKAAKAEAETDN